MREGQVELVVWGTDVAAVAIAARLAPTLTGVGQPDFVVLGADSAWKGIDGAVALGFFDSEWEVSETSFFQ